MGSIAGYAAALYNLALEQGQDPCVYRVRSGSDKYVVVSTSGTEPTNLVLPLNVLWVPSPDTVLRRTSKTATDPYSNTWVAETDFDSIFSTDQYWDEEDEPEPVLIGPSGGQLSGALYPRSSPSYADTEVVPQSIVKSLINAFKSSMLTMYQNMNNRVIYNDSRIRTLQATTADHETRITVLEGGQSQTVLLWSTEEAMDSWVIEHNLGDGYDVFITVISSDGDTIWPEEVQRYDGNTSIVYFLSACSGSAMLTAVAK